MDAKETLELWRDAREHFETGDLQHKEGECIAALRTLWDALSETLAAKFALEAQVEILNRKTWIDGFVRGVGWLRYKTTGFTSFPSERDEAESAAEETLCAIATREAAGCRENAIPDAQGVDTP